MRVLVAGATGNLGRHLVEDVLARGHDVVALARRPEKLGALRARLAGEVAADLTRPETLAGACEGADVVVSTVGLVGLAALRSRKTHAEVDERGNLNLLAEARRAGARKFVYASVVHAGEDDGVPLLRAKGRVEAAMRASGMEWLAARPTAFFDEIADGVLEPARRGLVALVGDGLARVAPLAAEDAAAWIADHLATADGVREIGGPDRFTYNGIAELAFQLLGRDSRVLHVPPGLARPLVGMTRLVPGSLHGELRFLEYATAHDFLAPPVGKRKLRAFLEERAGAPPKT